MATSALALPRPSGPPITITVALQLPSVRRGGPRMLAGRANVDRRIRWVHVGEVRNIAALLRGGELLLTTGMGIPPSPARLRAFVRQLAERGTSGIVLELRQDFEHAPAAVVEECEARGMPLIALEREVLFVEITEAVHEAVVDRQLAVLRRGEDLHQRFTELVLDGVAVPEILATLASVIAAPVLLDRAGEGVLYHATHRAPGSEVLAAWEAIRERPDWRQAAEHEAIIVPVAAAGQREWGHLAALALDSPLDDLDRVAVDLAVPLISLAPLRSREEELFETLEVGNFLTDVAADRLDPRDAARRAEALGFATGRRMLLPVVVTARRRGRGRTTDAVTRTEAGLTTVWGAARLELERSGLPLLVGSSPQEGDTLMVVALPDSRTRASAMDAVADAVHAAAARQAESVALTMTVGEAVTDWAALPAALQEAVEAAAACRDAPARRWHDATEASVDRLSRQLRDSPDVRAFTERCLGPLLEHDRRRATSLVATLDALYRAGGRKAEAARELHITRQSLYGRLTRIAAMLGDCDLDAPDTRFGLEFAVRIMRQPDAAG